MNIGFDAKRIYHNTTGLGNYSRDTVRLLSSTYPEHRYVLYTPKPGSVVFEHNPENTTIRFPERSVHKLFSSYWRRKWMVNQLVADGLDIYFGLSNELPTGLEKSNIKSLVTIHDLIFMRFPEFYTKIDARIYKYKFQRACQSANKIIAVSEQTKKDIVDFFHIDPMKIYVVYQGCNLAFQSEASQAQKSALLEKYNLSPGYILTVGSIEKRKNLLQLVKAIQPLKNLNLVVIGRKTSYFKQVSNYLIENDMQHRVRFFFGVPKEELPVFYQAAGLFVYPSVFEGFGIPIIEALFSKIPVISSTGSCFSEAGGPDSVYVDPHDTLALTNAIIEVSENNALRTDMIRSGFDYVQQFKDENVAKNLNEMIQSIAK